MRLIIFVLILIINGAYFGKFNPVFAEEKSFEVSPSIIKVSAESPSEIELPVILTNLGEEPLELSILVRPFDTDEYGKPSLILHRDYTNDMSKILSKTTLRDNNQNISKTILSPGQEKQLSLNIKIDEEIKAQDYYLSLIFISENNETIDTSTSSINLGLGTNILLSVGQRNPRILLDKLDSETFIKEGSLKFSLRLRNTGTSYASVYPEIEIKNIFGETLEKIELGERNIMAGKYLTLANSKDKMIYTESVFTFGPYIAEASVIDRQGVIQKESKVLIVTPGLRIVVYALILILAIITFYKIRRRYKIK